MLEVSQRQISKSFAAARERAKVKNSGPDEIARIRDDEHHEWLFAEDEKLDLRSKHLLKQARHLLITLPAWDDAQSWEDSQTSYHRLTIHAQRELLKHIRAEKKERSEIVRLWLPAIFAGLSAVAAWTAILRK